MKIGWVLGWATPGSWFSAEAAWAWPGAEHVCVPAAPDWFGRIDALGPLDAVGGYSLGTLLLLSERERVSARWARVGLMAPTWAFPVEAGRGGRVARAQVRALAGWTRRDERAAKADFYERAGLGLVLGATEPAETLRWGLGELERRAAEPGLPAGWFAAIGTDDALLDADALARAEPSVRRVRGATHSPAELIAEWARVFATTEAGA